MSERRKGGRQVKDYRYDDYFLAKILRDYATSYLIMNSTMTEGNLARLCKTSPGSFSRAKRGRAGVQTTEDIIVQLAIHLEGAKSYEK